MLQSVLVYSASLNLSRSRRAEIGIFVLIVPGSMAGEGLELVKLARDPVLSNIPEKRPKNLAVSHSILHFFVDSCGKKVDRGQRSVFFSDTPHYFAPLIF